MKYSLSLFISNICLALIYSVLITELSHGASGAAKNDTEGPKSQNAESTVARQVALFAGGCFWCLEPHFEKLPGVVDASVGYCGGKKVNASYYQVSSGFTNHLETVRVIYDPDVVSYEQLLDIFWKSIDPTDADGQYDDRGPQYSTVIFYHDQQQKEIAEASKRRVAESGKYKKPIVTRIVPASPFYLAEERHQNFYEKQFSTTRKKIK